MHGEALTLPYNCPNCGIEKTGKFCSHCGQKEDHRYDVHLLIHDLIHSITHADKGIFSYAWQLFYRPGKIAADKLAGRRKRYFNAFQYLIIILAVMVLVNNVTHFSDKMADSVASLQNDNSAVQASMQAVTDFMNKYQKLIYLLFIPLTTLFMKLLFRKQQYNYAEHLLGNVIMTSAGINFSILMALLFTVVKVPTPMYYWFNLILALLVQVMFCIQFYKEPWWRAAGKVGLLYLAWMVITTVVATIGMVIYMVSTR